MPLKLQRKFKTITPPKTDFHYFENLLLLGLTVLIVLSRYIPFFQSNPINTLYTLYLAVFLAYQSFRRSNDLYDTFKMPQLNMSSDNIQNIMRCICFVGAFVVSFLGLLPLNSNVSLSSILKSLSLCVFPYLCYDNINGTSSVDLGLNALIVVILGSSALLQYYGYAVFGLAVVICLVLKALSGMLKTNDNNSGKYSFIVVGLGVVAALGVCYAVWNGISFELPEISELCKGNTGTNVNVD